MKVTNVEAIPLNPRLTSRNADQKPRFAAIDTQTLFKVTTDNGITGYGDTRGHYSLTQAEVGDLVDRSPFDFVNGTLNAGLMGALYDAMGKHLEVPAYKLMGQKVRDRVPVAAWTRPASPDDLALEVQRGGVVAVVDLAALLVQPALVAVHALQRVRRRRARARRGSSTASPPPRPRPRGAARRRTRRTQIHQ